MDFNREYEDENMRFEDHGDILFIWYKEGMFTLEMAKNMVQERKKFTNFKDVKVLVIQAGLKGINKEARAYFSSDEAVEGVSAAAILAKNAFERHLANFFIGITVIRPKVPTRLFNDKQEALNWLNTLKEQ